MHLRLRAVLAAVSTAVLVAVLMPQAAEAQDGPTVTVTPAAGLRDGQTVSVTASGFVNQTTSGGSLTPSAFQCAAGVFPTTATFSAGSLPATRELTLQNCVFLGDFPTNGDLSNPSPPTTLNVVVHTTLTTGSGNTVRCGQLPNDCVILALGIVLPDAGLASAPISFGPAVPQNKADCKLGGWRTLANDQGQPFRNQGQCVSFVVAHRH